MKIISSSDEERKKKRQSKRSLELKTELKHNNNITATNEKNLNNPSLKRDEWSHFLHEKVKKRGILLL